MTNVALYHHIMAQYREGKYGADLSLAEIFRRAGYPTLLSSLTNDERKEIQDSISGMLKMAFNQDSQ